MRVSVFLQLQEVRTLSLRNRLFIILNASHFANPPGNSLDLISHTNVILQMTHQLPKRCLTTGFAPQFLDRSLGVLYHFNEVSVDIVRVRLLFQL